MSRPPAIYWLNKANMCRAIAFKMIEEGETKEGVRNLFRMSYALNMARYEQEREGEGQVKTEEIICSWCMDNTKSCKACDDGYEGE